MTEEKIKGEIEYLKNEISQIGKARAYHASGWHYDLAQIGDDFEHGCLGFMRASSLPYLVAEIEKRREQIIDLGGCPE